MSNRESTAKPKLELLAQIVDHLGRLLLQSGGKPAAMSSDLAGSSLYYAAFYGVCAALLERRQSFRKHSGVRAAFHREFIRTRLLDVK